MAVSHCTPHSKRFDYLLLLSIIAVLPGYVLGLVFAEETLPSTIYHYSQSVVELLHTMWWGVLIGVMFVGILHNIPRELVMLALGRGVFRATLAGVLFDLCSHGILMVGMKLYERGASLGQTMAFLVASPWNSLSLTLILWALMGFGWMLAFLVLSFVIAIITGFVFDVLVDKGVLPKNPNAVEFNADIHFMKEARSAFQAATINSKLFVDILYNGIKGSRVVIKWLFIGVVLASLVRVLVPIETFQQWFGPTVFGVAMTVLAATLIEVCSEGSAPIAADIMNRAHAPGNSFIFLMGGVSTDYTEIMSIRETTSSWKIALFLPLVTLPQIVVLGLFLNQLSL